MAGMAPRLQGELVAVPGAYDVALALVILERARALLGVRGLDHLAHDAPLADRSAQVCAHVVPGVKLAVDAEHADFSLTALDDPAVALGEFGKGADAVLRHAPSSQDHGRRAVFVSSRGQALRRRLTKHRPAYRVWHVPRRVLGPKFRALSPSEAFPLDRESNTISAI